MKKVAIFALLNLPNLALDLPEKAMIFRLSANLESKIFLLLQTILICHRNMPISLFWLVQVDLLRTHPLVQWIVKLDYSEKKRHGYTIYGLPGHFDKNFHKYQMKIGLKLDDTPSLGHLAGQEVPHQPFFPSFFKTC